MTRGERFLWLGLETGARSEAIRQLTWDRVDWETKTIDFNVPGRKRTKKRRAVVPISQALMPVLKRMYEQRNSDLVLDTESELARLINRIADRAGIAGVTPHVLRHTAATHMARRGVPLWIVAKVLGDTIATVERIYAKHAPEDLRGAVDQISGEVVGVGK
jgi:integrase